MVGDSGPVDILPKEQGLEGMTYNGLFLFKGLISIDLRFVFCKFFHWAKVLSQYAAIDREDKQAIYRGSKA